MITTYQIRNVLRVYGDQLRRKSSSIQESVRPNKQPTDLVDISIDARRKQMVNQMSNHLISQITPHDHREGADGGGNSNKPLPTLESGDQKHHLLEFNHEN